MKRPQDQFLPKPTVELISIEGARFDTENKFTEKALTELVQQFPKNSD